VTLSGPSEGPDTTDRNTPPKRAVLTQSLLAEMANASPNTVARFVERIVQAGWIDWTYRQVTILDTEALSAVVAGTVEVP
jgi:DNA-binding transcriptional regulator YhcF (GntR family)